MALVGWLDPDTEDGLMLLTELWADGAALDPTVRDHLLTVAYDACAAYAPTLPDGAAVPAGWVQAQLAQARAVHRAALTGDGDTIGAEGYTITTYPMDRTVKQLLRPRRGRPVVR